MTEQLTPWNFRERVRERAQAQFPDLALTDGEDERGLYLGFTVAESGTGHMYVTNAYGHYRAGQALDQAIDDLLRGVPLLLSHRAQRTYAADFANAREHLMVQLHQRTDPDDEQEAKNQIIQVPWQGDLVLRPALDYAETLVLVTRGQADDWGVSDSDLVNEGLARTRDKLALTTGNSNTILCARDGGVVVTYWHNDLPGYTGTRAAFPDLALPALPTGKGYGIVVAPDRDFCVSVLTDNIDRIETAFALTLLTELVRKRVDQPRLLMAPGIAFARPDGTYEYQPIGPAGARA